MILGNHTAIRRVLERILREEVENFRKLAMKRGVRPSDADDVIQETYFAVHNLEPQNDIAELLAKWQQLPQDKSRSLIESKFDDALTALFVFYLKFRCSDYHRKQKREKKTFESLDDLLAERRIILFDDPEIRNLLVDLELTGIYIDDLVRGDEGEFSKFIDYIADNSGLDSLERAYFLFRVNNPEAPDKEFDPSLPAYKIARLKATTFRKVRTFLRKIL